MYYLGFDPGIKGIMAIIDDDMKLEFWPVSGIMALSKRVWEIRENAVACIENVTYSGSYNRGKKSEGAGHNLAKLQQSMGLAKGMLVANIVPYKEIHPRTWQAAMLKGVGGANVKEKSRKAAMVRLASYANEFKWKKDHDKADAANLALYCKSVYLSGGFKE